MPPRPKFTKDEVLEAALAIVRNEGYTALTARRLGAELGASARPLFTLFENMEDIANQLYEGPAKELWLSYFGDYEEYPPAFKRVGMQIIAFANEEPQIFRFLFIEKRGEASKSLEEWSLTEMGITCVKLIMRDYGFDEETATVFFEEMWLHCFSLCVLKVTGAVAITDQQCSDSISRMFLGMYTQAKAGIITNQGLVPVEHGQNNPTIIPDIKIESPFN